MSDSPARSEPITVTDVFESTSPLRGCVKITLHLYSPCTRNQQEGTARIVWKDAQGSLHKAPNEVQFNYLDELPSKIRELLHDSGLKYEILPHPKTPSALLPSTFRRNKAFYDQLIDHSQGFGSDV